MTKSGGRKHKCATLVQMSISEHMFKKMYRAESAIEQRFRCIYCRQVITLKTVTAEHAQPLSKGGGTDRKNIKGACDLCNWAKANKTEAEFRRILHSGGIPLGNPAIMSAYIRFRINSRVERAEKRIKRFVGMEGAR
jgi:HNH endonuclease